MIEAGDDIQIENYLVARFRNLPLHRTVYRATNPIHLASLPDMIQKNESTLISKDLMQMTPLHMLCSNPIATGEMIETLKIRN